MVEVAKISSQGQVTIPLEIRKALKLESGDKIAFVTNETGEFVLMNASVLTLKKAQQSFKGAAKSMNVKNEDELLQVIKENR